ncbi:MFS transporter [Evansella tamaricis]|uniref:MFS transporter n=1 Tax=Evansella tamaricis TaxID=2069301 RepID=A0ABS6JMC6_9BACI|nr:MFS transporter [Evansella tamaricis]MBU9714829.1 MFS transporter [Evansella tamaricis]
MLILFYSLIIVAFLDTFIQLPVISPYAQSLGASSILTGMIIAVYSLANMIGNGISGHWIDRYGRKKILCYGMLFVSITLFLYPLAQTGWALFFTRLLHGLAGGALIPAAFAYLGDIAPKNRRGKSMAFSGACIGTAAIIGPALGGMISARYSIEMVFYFVAFLFLITAFAAFLGLKESFKITERREVSLSDFQSLLKNPLLFQAIFSGFSLMVSMGILTYAFPLKMELLGWSSSITGVLLSSFGIMALVIFLTPLNHIFDKNKPQTLICLGMGIIGVALISLSFIDAIYGITLAIVSYGIGFSLIFPSMNRMVVEVSTKSDRGKAFGIFYAAYSLGVVFGSFIAGVMHDGFGHPFLLGGLFLLGMLVIFSVLWKHWTNYLVMKQPGDGQVP